MTAALLFLLSCAGVEIQDYQFYSPIPGNLGCVSDWFLHSDQEIMTQAQCTTLQDSWIESGQAVECTNSDAVAGLKREIEEVCSVTKCDYATQAAVAKVSAVLEKVASTGRKTIR